jgi:hypothetical protein
VYRERGGRGSRIWIWSCVGVYVAGVAWMGALSLPEDLGAWLAVSGMFLLPLAPCLVVPLSKRRYHDIDVTPDTLRVGRERIPVAELDPGSVHQAQNQLAAGGGGVLGNLTSSMNSGLTIRGRNVVDKSLPRLVGGAYAVPMGMASVAVATRHGERLLVATRSPEAFLTALAQVVR